MPKTSLRYQNFLNGYQFYSNSINFRILSSKSLEKFKNVQAFQLNQLANGKFYFSLNKREVLLLKYDMWSRWIYEIENLCIELLRNEEARKVTKNDIDLIILLANKTSEKYTSIILQENTDKFDKEFCKIWLELHQYTYNFMINQIRHLVGLSYPMMFSKLIDLLINILQYTLFEIHELDILFCNSKNNCEYCDDKLICNHNENKMVNSDNLLSFIIISNFTKTYQEITGTCLIDKRIEIYKKYFDIKEIYFKNYTDEKIPFNLINSIEKHNIKLNMEKSLFHKD